jgi:hypothetical protein
MSSTWSRTRSTDAARGISWNAAVSRPTVEFHRVLADLQDCRYRSGLCPGRDCLRMLKRDDVEGGDSDVRVDRLIQEVTRLH